MHVFFIVRWIMFTALHSSIHKVTRPASLIRRVFNHHRNIMLTHKLCDYISGVCSVYYCVIVSLNTTQRQRQWVGKITENMWRRPLREASDTARTRLKTKSLQTSIDAFNRCIDSSLDFFCCLIVCLYGVRIVFE